MEKKIKKVKDKEGVIFEIVLDLNVNPNSRETTTVKFVKRIIEEKLKSNFVYPKNNKVGFHGEIEQMSYFISGLIELYLFENQYSIKNNT